MKDIMLKITGKTLAGGDSGIKEDETIEFTTEGKISYRGKTAMISYPESELSGLEGWTTYLTVKENEVRMNRSNGKQSPMQTVMVFEKGRRYESAYETPYGRFEMEILTNSVSPLIDIGDGKSALSIDYSVSLKGLSEARHLLDIEVRNLN